ncbi:MAG TPA: VWA domain-containing protein [Flavobacteriales bacterium]
MSTGTYRKGIMLTAVLVVELLAWAFGLSLFLTASRHLPQFRIERSWVLYGLFAGPVLTALYLVGLWLRERSLRRFGQARLLPALVPGVSSWRSVLRFLLLRHGLTFAVFALAGPQMGTHLEQVKARGVDVVVALDVSNSMLAEDLVPDRMAVAKRALAQMIDRMKGDRLGIVIFAGQAFTQLPITADRSAAKLFLESIGPDMVSTQGTAIGAAIELAQQSFQKEGPQGKAIIVISDGESFEDDGEAAAKTAYEQGVLVHTVGLGSPQGAPIPERRGGQVLGFKKDKEGATVMTRLNEDMLQRIAAAGHGEYVHATAGDTGIDQLVADLRAMDQNEIGSYTFTGHEDRYQYFLAIAIVLITLGLWMGERTFREDPDRPQPWNA